MVHGLEIFREYFQNCMEQYVLIGGTACDLLMNNAGFDFRVTKDLDMVLFIELFSRKPDFVALKENDHLIRIHTEEDISSLSAILMDESYYQLCLNGKIQKRGLSILRAEHLIPLKAKAWLDLNQRQGDSGEIEKHRNDIFRLFQIIDPDYSINLPTDIQNNFMRFVETMKTESFDIKNIGIATAKAVLIKEMVNYYKL